MHLTWPVFVQRVVAGKVQDSFIAQTPLENDLAPRDTEVASTVMHISSLSSVAETHSLSWVLKNEAERNTTKPVKTK